MVTQSKISPQKLEYMLVVVSHQQPSTTPVLRSLNCLARSGVHAKILLSCVPSLSSSLSARTNNEKNEKERQNALEGEGGVKLSVELERSKLKELVSFRKTQTGIS